MERDNQSVDIQWEPRVAKDKIRQLYVLNAQGILDEALIDEVGYALYSRCASILTVTEAEGGQVTCPRCTRFGRVSMIPHQREPDEILRCTACGWELTWGNYRQTFRRKQLGGPGALPAFQHFMQEFTRARSPRTKMIAIDCVLHAYHHSLRDPHRLTRPAAVNLVEGSFSDLITFFNTLTYGDQSLPETSASYAEWHTHLNDPAISKALKQSLKQREKARKQQETSADDGGEHGDDGR